MATASMAQSTSNIPAILRSEQRSAFAKFCQVKIGFRLHRQNDENLILVNCHERCKFFFSISLLFLYIFFGKEGKTNRTNWTRCDRLVSKSTECRQTTFDEKFALSRFSQFDAMNFFDRIERFPPPTRTTMCRIFSEWTCSNTNNMTNELKKNWRKFETNFVVAANKSKTNFWLRIRKVFT